MTGFGGTIIIVGAIDDVSASLPTYDILTKLLRCELPHQRPRLTYHR